MTFATEGTWSPWTFHNEEDELTGFDIEVARAVAAELGVEAAFAEGEWDGLLAGLDSGRFDTMANGVSVTPEREEQYDFTEPYAYNRIVVITMEDSAIASLEDLDGMRTANTLGSSYATLAESYGATNTGVDDFNQTIELLEQGRIDATLNDEGRVLRLYECAPGRTAQDRGGKRRAHARGVPAAQGGGDGGASRGHERGHRHPACRRYAREPLQRVFRYRYHERFLKRRARSGAGRRG